MYPGILYFFMKKTKIGKKATVPNVFNITQQWRLKQNPKDIPQISGKYILNPCTGCQFVLAN